MHVGSHRKPGTISSTALRPQTALLPNERRARQSQFWSRASEAPQSMVPLLQANASGCSSKTLHTIPDNCMVVMMRFCSRASHYAHSVGFEPGN